jgi:hypothetical protein
MILVGIEVVNTYNIVSYCITWVGNESDNPAFNFTILGPYFFGDVPVKSMTSTYKETGLNEHLLT